MHCTFNRGTMSSSFTTLYTYPTPFSLISFDSIGGGANAKQRKKTVDAVAASLMLEGYLTFKKRQK